MTAEPPAARRSRDTVRRRAGEGVDGVAVVGGVLRREPEVRLRRRRGVRLARRAGQGGRGRRRVVLGHRGVRGVALAGGEQGRRRGGVGRVVVGVLRQPARPRQRQRRGVAGRQAAGGRQRIQVRPVRHRRLVVREESVDAPGVHHAVRGRGEEPRAAEVGVQVAALVPLEESVDVPGVDLAVRGRVEEVAAAHVRPEAADVEDGLAARRAVARGQVVRRLVEVAEAGGIGRRLAVQDVTVEVGQMAGAVRQSDFDPRVDGLVPGAGDLERERIRAVPVDGQVGGGEGAIDDLVAAGVASQGVRHDVFRPDEGPVVGERHAADRALGVGPDAEARAVRRQVDRVPVEKRADGRIRVGVNQRETGDAVGRLGLDGHVDARAERARQVRFAGVPDQGRGVEQETGFERFERRRGTDGAAGCVGHAYPSWSDRGGRTRSGASRRPAPRG